MKSEEGKRGERGMEGRGGECRLPNNQFLHFLKRELMLLIKAPINFRDGFPDKGAISKYGHTRGLEI